MINIYKKIVLALILVFASVATGCSQGDNSNAVEETQQNESVLEIKIVDSNEEIKREIDVSDKTTLMDILQDNFTVDEANGFINGIAGVTANEKDKEFIAIYVNGESAMKGANDLQVMNGDVVELILETWE